MSAPTPVPKTAAETAAALPGMTRNFGNPSTEVVPFAGLRTLGPEVDRKVVLLATATITNENIFSNGLFQNVFILYRMFEAMGYKPILIVHEKPKSPDAVPPMLRACRTIPTEEIILKPLPVVALIEIGMSIDPLVREHVKMLGGKLAKLYLGNILNIDVETPIFYPGIHFAHHIIEKIDRVWVSPHYGQHAEYAAYLNHVLPPSDLKNMIAPYVWDPCVVTRDGELHPRWRPRAGPEDDAIVIMEPNISFQKSCIVPLLAVERWARARAAAGKPWTGKVYVINGQRLNGADIDGQRHEGTPHFTQTIRPRLSLVQEGRVEFLDRKDILTTMRTWPSALFVGHQVNNEYNYMTLELMWCGFPIVHNSAEWSAFGYSYAGNDIVSAAAQIELAYSCHNDRQETYKAHAAALAWRHSPYNPAVHAAWDALMKV